MAKNPKISDLQCFDEALTGEEIERMFDEVMVMGYVTLKCGCKVEPDGVCPHGNESPLLGMAML